MNELAAGRPDAEGVAPASLVNHMPEWAFHRLNPKKLRLSKWTAVHPRNQEKHFLVTRVINPKAPADRIEQVVMEAVLTRRHFTLSWTGLADKKQWLLS